MATRKRQQDNTAQTIVRAALESLEKHGPEGLTVRQIATEAQVNVAAINYHFGSKENLLAQVLEQASINAFQDIDERITAQGTTELEGQLREFLTELANGLIEYPNVSRFFVQQLMQRDTADNAVKQRLETFLEALAVRFARLHGQDNLTLEAKLQAVKLISVLISIALMPSVIDQALGLDARDHQMRAALVESFLKR